MRDTVRYNPYRPLNYLQHFQPQGPVFNDCLWGGYLIWNVRNIPVFIDSRIDIYEYNGVFADYLDALGIKNTLEILNKYHIRYVLLSARECSRLSPDEQHRMDNALSGPNHGVAGADCHGQIASPTSPMHSGLDLIRVGAG